MLPFMLESFEVLGEKSLLRKPKGDEVSEVVDVEEDAMLSVLGLLIVGVVCCRRSSDISRIGC